MHTFGKILNIIPSKRSEQGPGEGGGDFSSFMLVSVRFHLLVDILTLNVPWLQICYQGVTCRSRKFATKLAHLKSKFSNIYIC